MTDTVILGIIGSVTSLATLIISSKLNNKVNDYHKEVDGKMSKLLDRTNDAARAEGKLEVKNELIEVLKKTEPLKDTDENKK